MESKYKEEIRKLENLYDNLLPKAKSWNRDRFLLVWGFTSAIFAMTGIEVFKIVARDYNFKWADIFFKIIKYPNDFYLIGMLIFFVVFWVVTYKIGKIIDENADDINKTLNVLKKEIDFLKK